MAGGLWDYDVPSDTLLCSARWYAIMGLDPTVHRIDTREKLRRFIHPDDAEAATQIDHARINELIEADERYHIEFRIVRPRGQIGRIRSVACLIHDPVTGNLRAVGCIADASGENTPTAAALPPGLGDDATRRSERILSDREGECLAWVSIGKTAWETAVILGISARTVEFHLHNATRKLGAVNKVHAVALAIRAGML
ncbi:helix-turn-helix transcriptional regulator [Sphingomonas sp.]|uniref:helix-turn-helix transcriptional regulator n=1 Tax=Sphingomonas sp. TaxID=28214 RepID=UPI002DD669AF|nr:LuxR C-terminal-related transcriptional regulator [Sphingomonas sp.]